jgi:hypothetical protein
MRNRFVVTMGPELTRRTKSRDVRRVKIQLIHIQPGHHEQPWQSFNGYRAVRLCFKSR